MTASRGASSSVKRSPEASRSVAPSPRTASVTSRPSAVAPGAASAVGWNWQSSRSASAAPAASAITEPAPIAPRGLVVRCHRAAAPPVASTVARALTRSTSVITPWQREPSLHSARAEVPSATWTLGSAAASCREPLGDAAARARASRVHDPPPGVAALEGQLELAVGPAVELDAASLELEHDCRRFVREHLGGRRPARPAPGGDGVRDVLGDRVVGADRSGEPALGPEARGLAQGLARDDDDLASALGGDQRRIEAGSSAADHGEVVVRGRWQAVAPYAGY